MYLTKINDDIAFFLSCRCNVGQVCAVTWRLKNGERFPVDFNELFHTKDIPVFLHNIKDIEGCKRYMVYKDPFVRMVDNYSLMTTGKRNDVLRRIMKRRRGFLPDDSFDDFMEKVVRKEIKDEWQEGHFEPQSFITDRFDIDYVVYSEDLPLFFNEMGLPFNDFEYNECEQLDYEQYRKYEPEILELYKEDLKIPETNNLWLPKTDIKK